MTWVLANLGLLADRTLAHLALAIPSIAAAFALSIPLGWAAYRYGPIRGPLLTGAGLLYAIPSLPLFVALPVLIGTGARDPVNVIVALTLYGIALMTRSVADALAAVPPETRQSATATGYAPWGRFWGVEMPLAGPAILAGLRVVTVSTVSLVTVSAVLGVESLGLLFTDGFQRGIVAEVLAGLVLTIAVALALDALVVLGGRLLMPWTRTARGRRTARRAVVQGVGA